MHHSFELGCRLSAWRLVNVIRENKAVMASFLVAKKHAAGPR
jgi:hypothetical protein